MSGENGGQNGPEGTGAGEGGKTEGNKPFTPVTYNSQEELNAAFADRSTRAAESARKEALKGLPEGMTLEQVVEAAGKFQQAENEKKDEVTRERERAEAAEAQIQAYKRAEARAALAKDVAKEIKYGDVPVPAELLQGNTEDELKASGAAILAFLETLGNGPRPPAHNKDQGAGGSGTDAGGPTGDWLRDAIQTRNTLIS